MVSHGDERTERAHVPQHGADGRNAEAFAEEMRHRTERPRLPRSRVGKALLAVVVVAIIVVAALNG
ncbi:MAG TPA: hypothetical protein VFJ14_15645 [Nocardioidaceae bacterium]|nr:hypothetical protein [Nocardioidaceae bacterium]